MQKAVGWIDACNVDDIDEEDVMRFDYGDRTLAIYKSAKGKFYATDGICTHEKVHLADGLVIGNLIECPKHNGRFDYTTGEPKRIPVCEKIETFPVKVEGDKVYVNFG